MKSSLPHSHDTQATKCPLYKENPDKADISYLLWLHLLIGVSIGGLSVYLLMHYMQSREIRNEELKEKSLKFKSAA